MAALSEVPKASWVWKEPAPPRICHSEACAERSEGPSEESLFNNRAPEKQILRFAQDDHIGVSCKVAAGQAQDDKPGASCFLSGIDKQGTRSYFAGPPLLRHGIPIGRSGRNREPSGLPTAST